MAGKLLTLAGLLLFVGGGCRACSSCGDYLPPVAGSTQDWSGPRAGSRFGRMDAPDEDSFPELENSLEESPPADASEPGIPQETVTPLPGLDENL